MSWPAEESGRVPGFADASPFASWFFVDSASGQAWYQVSKDGPALAADGGYVVVETWDGSTIEGWYYLTFEDGDCIMGSYAGPWCDNDPKCG